jgi:hypothetical protein
MKLNFTHAAIGLGILFLVLRAAKANKTSTAGAGQTAPVQESSQWWVYAGQWGN